MAALPWPRVFDRIIRRSGRRPTPLVRSLPLRAGEVLRLDAGRHAAMDVRVTHGTIWLTTTPATGDTILRAGDRLVLTRGWPVVAQAMGAEAVVEVTWGDRDEARG